MSTNEARPGLNKEELSGVWKNGGNTLPSGLTLDLKEHLRRQRLRPEWVACKERVLDVIDFPAMKKLHGTNEIQILEVGCGLGEDSVEMAIAASNAGLTASFSAIDFNTTMVTEATELFDKVRTEQRISSPSVQLRVQQADLFALPFPNESFDIVRCDITLQHVLSKLGDALQEISRVLKPNGRLIALEGAASQVFTSDPTISAFYNSVLPPDTTGGTAVAIKFALPKYSMRLNRMEGHALVTDGPTLAGQDVGWVKMKGMSHMLQSKGLRTQEECETFMKGYIEACEKDLIIGIGTMFVIEAVKLTYEDKTQNIC
eukprot:PhF_6_TR44518/c0_g1_i2/m.68571